MATCSAQKRFREVKDFLQSFISDKKPVPTPTGAVPSIWMTLPPAPQNHFDEVFPKLFLGDYKLATDREQLSELSFTYVLNCAQGTKMNHINTDEEYFQGTGITMMGVRASDIFTYQIKKHFEETAEFIHSALQSGGKLYVHCQSGVSRSATLVMSYLMLKQHMDLITAVKTVRSKREIFPNDGFLKQLVELEKQLSATVERTTETIL